MSMSTVLGLRASSFGFHNRVADYVERAAATAEGIAATSNAPINMGPHVAALRAFAAYVRSLDVDDQSLRALHRLSGASPSGPYEPGINQRKLFSGVASPGTAGAPSNDNLMLELVGQAVEDTISRHDDERVRLQAEADQAESATGARDRDIHGASRPNRSLMRNAPPGPRLRRGLLCSPARWSICRPW